LVYATTQDAIDLYGEDYILTSVDRDENGVADTPAFADAITQGQSELDSYIGVLYNLPLVNVPDVLVRFTVDVAVYVSSMEAGTLTKEKTKRYERAIAWAVKVSEGKASLGLEDEPKAKGGGVSLESGTRIFTRAKMAGVL
jgi:phage gp36-like protein